jgi:hypothetical protein
VKKTMSIALLCGAALLWDAAALTEPASSQPPQTTTYHYALPLTLALEAATEAIRVCAEHGYRVSATVVDMDGVPQVALRGDGATVHTGESSFEKAFAVVTLGPIFDFDTSVGSRPVARREVSESRRARRFAPLPRPRSNEDAVVPRHSSMPSRHTETRNIVFHNPAVPVGSCPHEQSTD